MAPVHEHRDTGGHISTEPRINERIRVPEVRLVGPAGEQVGIVAINDALRLAQEADLDLVEVAPMARPPVCKLMDYGKFKYESALKARESRKNQAQTVIKEIKLRPKIDPHDYGTKKGHVERFLKQGDKVKVTIMFRGREQSRPELGFKLLQRLAGDIEELGFVESSPKQDGRNMIMVIGPHKRKTDAMAAAKAEKASRAGSRGSESTPAQDEPHAARTRRAPAQPQAVQPASAQPEAAEPELALAQPDTAEPEPAQPEAGDSAPAQSAQAKPTAAKPAAPAKSTAAKPAAPAKPAGQAKPTAPRSTSASAARPGPGSGTGTASPRPTAPRGTTAAARPSPARRAADGPVPAQRPVAADKAAQAAAPKEIGEADS